jgi:hypothetical protein
VAAYLAHWLPRLRDQYPEPPASPVTLEEQKLDSMYHPEYMLRPELAEHPAHLHINLLPQYQGAGHGRALMSTFLASVAGAGATSCYLAVRNTNTGALGFYHRLGWRPVPVPDAGETMYLARSTKGALWGCELGAGLVRLEVRRRRAARESTDGGKAVVALRGDRRYPIEVDAEIVLIGAENPASLVSVRSSR